VVDLVHRSVHFWLNHRRTGVISHRYPIVPASRRPTVSFFRFSIFVLFGFFNFRSRSHFVPPCYLVTVRVSSSSGFVDRLLSISHFVSFFFVIDRGGGVFFIKWACVLSTIPTTPNERARELAFFPLFPTGSRLCKFSFVYKGWIPLHYGLQKFQKG
jgi:hypothetical protein